MKTKNGKPAPNLRLTLNKRTIAALNHREMAYVGGHAYIPPEDSEDTRCVNSCVSCRTVEVGITPC